VSLVHRSLRSRLCLFAVCTSVVLPGSGYSQNAPKAKQESNAGRPTEQVYKNIQVLKGIPANELIPAMQFMTASLGVECGFCHVERHFDQDDKKPKQIARKMMQMVSTINQNNFDDHREVTCNSCHRGSRVPVSIPAISQEAGMMRADANAEEELPPGLPSPDDLLNKYVQAVGGSAAIEKVTTRIETGTANFFGRQIAVQIFDKTPDKRLSVMHLPDGDSITGFDGNQGWLANPHRPVLAMSGAEVEWAKMDADLELPLHLKQLFPDLKPAQPEKINSADAYQLIAVVAGQPRVRVYFDQQSGLLVRMVRYADSPLGLNPLQIDYADYRPVDGIQVPYRWTTSRPEGQFTIQITDVKQDVAIEDTQFVKPQN
jgi:photosynthetic reaction center cytochrome c subunit